MPKSHEGQVERSQNPILVIYRQSFESSVEGLESKIVLIFEQTAYCPEYSRQQNKPDHQDAPLILVGEVKIGHLEKLLQHCIVLYLYSFEDYMLLAETFLLYR